MTAPSEMTNDDLLEQAPLDALGLLDENDAAMFERAFYSAPPALQRKVREIQAAVVADSAHLCSEEPDRALRRRVLSGVMGEISRSREELAPLAVIGRAEGEGEVVHRRRLFAETRHTYFWRAASLVLAAGLVTSLFFYAKAVQENSDLLTQFSNNQLTNETRAKIGLPLSAIVNKARVQIPMASPDRSCSGTVFIDDTSGALVAWMHGLQRAGEEYTLVVRGPDSRVWREKKVATSPDGSGTARIDFVAEDLPMLTQATFAILDSRGTTILVSV